MAAALQAAVQVDRTSGSVNALQEHQWPTQAVIDLYGEAPRT
jgi:hypothetical protein